MDVENEDLASLRDLASRYQSDERQTFAEPWQARAFALVVALAERGTFSLRDFQAALIGRLTAFEREHCITGTSDYYTRWVEALEDILADKSMMPADRLAHLERDVVDDAESRKVHQRMTSRDEHGVLKIAPLLVDAGAA